MLHTVRFHLYSEKGKTMETTKFRRLEGVWMKIARAQDFGGSKNNVKKKTVKRGIYVTTHLSRPTDCTVLNLN